MKSLACRIGRHKWELRTDHGEEFKVCAVCGKFEEPPSSGPRGSAEVDGAGTGDSTSVGGGAGDRLRVRP